MSKISIEYDEENGTFKADGDIKLEMPMLPVLKQSTEKSAEIFEDLVDLGSTSVRKALEPAEDILKA